MRLRNAADDERQRFFLWSPVAVGLGIAAYFALPAEPTLWLAFVPPILALLMRQMIGRGTLSAAAVTALVLAATGFVLAKVRVETVRAPVLEKTMRKATIEGAVLNVEPRPPRGARLTIRIHTLSGLPDAKRPRIVRVRAMTAVPPLRMGDRVRLTAKLSPPARPALPGGFDFARSAWFHQIGAVGYTYRKIEVTPRGPPATVTDAVLRAIDQLRQTVTARILQALPGDTGGIAAALITGERGGISDETNDVYRAAGLFHILSISGLHMVIMAGAVFYSVRLILAAIPPIALRYPIKKWAALAGMLGALAYLSISGGAFATVRSALMIMVIFGAVLLDRPALALRNVALSALLILIVYPESLFDAGFQMSFAAVTGLVASCEEVRHRAGRRNEPHHALRPLIFFGGIVFSTLVASAAVAPFAAYHFHQSQQYAVLANLVAIPISNFLVMPAALAALVLMPLGLEGLALHAMGLGIDATTWCANAVASLPGAVGHIPAIPWTAFALLVFGGLWFALWQTRQRVAGVILCVAGLACAPFMRRPDILIAGYGDLVAVRGADGRLSALPGHSSKFELSRWLQADGDARTPAEVQMARAFTCDGVGCVANVKGMTIAVARRPASIADDCHKADIAVLDVPRPDYCATKSTVIDFFDIWREGTHALYIVQEGSDRQHVEIDTVASHRGDRPWAPLISKRQRTTRPKLPTPNIAKSQSGSDSSPQIGEQMAPKVPSPSRANDDDASAPLE